MKINLYPIQARGQSMARYKKPENQLPQKTRTETRRTIRNHKGDQTSNVPIEIANDVENSQCLPHHTTQAI